MITKSTDSIHFNDIDSLPPLSDTNSIHSYQYTDPGLTPGTTWYQLRLIDINGNLSYSPVRPVVVIRRAAVSSPFIPTRSRTEPSISAARSIAGTSGSWM